MGGESGRTAESALVSALAMVYSYIVTVVRPLGGASNTDRRPPRRRAASANPDLGSSAGKSQLRKRIYFRLG
jgi:hypothetical protein